MQLFIDCEFDVPTDQLISMALVSLDGKQIFYEVIDVTPTDPWVIDNVMNCLNKLPITKEQFITKLDQFVEKFSSIEIIADHPADPYYFLKWIIREKGEWFRKPFTIKIDDYLSAKGSVILHNALEDAKAIRLDWFNKNGIIPD